MHPLQHLLSEVLSLFAILMGEEEIAFILIAAFFLIDRTMNSYILKERKLPPETLELMFMK